MVARARASSSWTVSSVIAFLIPCSATGQRRASVQAHPASPSFFDGLTEEELARVLGRLEHRRFAAGTVLLAAGETLREMSLFAQQPASATVRAQTDTDVLVLTDAEFEHAATQLPPIYRNLGAIL